MYFANPWGLLGLLALPVIAGIHLYRRRFPPLCVAGTHLWGVETRVTDAGRRRDKLPITASLGLELLAALLLSLALADPRRNDTQAVVHLVAVLDDSASMRAQPAGKLSFRDQVIAELRGRAAVAGRETCFTLVRTGPHPTLAGSRAMTWADAEPALQSWVPSAPQHSFQTAWDEALQLVGDHGRFLFLTDHPPEFDAGLPRGMEVVALGEPLDNCAFTAARWTAGTDGRAGNIFLRVANLSATAANVHVVGTAQGQPVFNESLTIRASAEAPLEIAALHGLGRIDVTLSQADDALSIDNHVTLIEPRPRIVQIAVDLAVDSPESRSVRKALDAQRGWQLSAVDAADLVIGDTARETGAPDQWQLRLGPLNRAEAVRKQSVDLVGPYLLERQNPLLDGVSLGGVVWGGVQPTTLRLSPLISVNQSILLGRVEGAASSSWVLNLDLSRSNLSDSPDWPILMANLVELRRDALPGQRRWNYRLGEAVQWRLPATAATANELVCVTPSGRRRALVRDRNDLVELPALDEPGVYEVYAGTANAGTFAANFLDPAESSLAGLSRAHVEPATHYEPSKISLDNPFSWLMVVSLLLTLTALLLDWRLVDRRRLRHNAEVGS